jgi:hypothetical protein
VAAWQPTGQHRWAKQRDGDCGPHVRSQPLVQQHHHLTHLLVFFNAQLVVTFPKGIAITSETYNLQFT